MEQTMTCVSYSQNLGEVCADYTCSLYKLRLKFVQTSAEVSRKYYVLTNLSTRTYDCICVYSLKCLRVLTEMSTMYSLESSTFLLNCRLRQGLFKIFN